MRNANVGTALIFCVLATACGSEEHPLAAEPAARGESSALFAASTVIMAGEAPLRFHAEVVEAAPAYLACRLEVQRRSGGTVWAGRWRVEHIESGAVSIALDAEYGQQAISRSGPGLPLVIQCRGSAAAGWFHGEQSLAQPLCLQPPAVAPVGGGFAASLPAGGVLGWALTEARLGATARQVTHWVELADGSSSVLLPGPTPGISLHYWWASRGVPCLRGGHCDDSAWAEAMLWLRHTEVSYEPESHHAPSRH